MSTLVRFILYIAKKATAIVVVFILILLATFIAYDCANMFVILNEGFTQRAEAVLRNDSQSMLNKFFTQEYLSTDQVLADNPYQRYFITGYDVQIRVKSLWAWPWDKYAKVVIEEEVKNIKGTPREKDEKGEEKLPPWKNGEKIVVMKKDEGRWRIDKVVFVKPLKPLDKNVAAE